MCVCVATMAVQRQTLGRRNKRARIVATTGPPHTSLTCDDDGQPFRDCSDSQRHTNGKHVEQCTALEGRRGVWVGCACV